MFVRGQALKREQLAALVGAADPKNPVLVLIAAFVAKNVQNGNRAAQEYLLDWEELSEVIGDGIPMLRWTGHDTCQAARNSYSLGGKSSS